MMHMKDIYGISAIVMLFVIFFNVWNLYASWDNMILPAKLSFIFSSIVFNSVFLIMFIGLWKITPKLNQALSEEELNQIFKDYKNDKAS